MSKPTVARMYRLGLAALIMVAITTQLLTFKQPLLNFFSYFTMLSNLLAGYVLLSLSVDNVEQKKIDALRGAATCYLLMSGLGFILLLDSNKEFLVGWVNGILHYLAPTIMLFDWIYLPPAKIALKQTLSWTIFPFSYLLYALIRGAVTNWYPYGFLNLPEAGYLGLCYASLITGCCLATTWCLANLKRS